MAFDFVSSDGNSTKNKNEKTKQYQIAITIDKNGDLYKDMLYCMQYMKIQVQSKYIRRALINQIKADLSNIEKQGKQTEE